VGFAIGETNEPFHDERDEPPYSDMYEPACGRGMSFLIVRGPHPGFKSESGGSDEIRKRERSFVDIGFNSGRLYIFWRLGKGSGSLIQGIWIYIPL